VVKSIVSTISLLVYGINVNVRTNDFPTAIATNSTSLLEVCGREIALDEVLITVLKDLDTLLSRFYRKWFLPYSFGI